MDMKEEEFRRSSYVLGKDHSIDILNLVHSEGWSKASDIAKKLDLHIATASKYLAELEDINLFESREAKGKTRMVVEYRIKDPKIELTLDISEKNKGGGSLENFYTDVYRSILKRTEKVYGTVSSDVKDYTNSDSMDTNDLKEGLLSLLQYNEERLGLFTTQRLVCSACKPIIATRNNIPDKKELFKDLPFRYFEKLLEEIR